MSEYSAGPTPRIVDQLRALRRRLRLWVVVVGAALTAAGLAAGLFAAGLLDWFVHVDDAGVRLLLLLIILAWTAALAWRFIVVPLREPLTLRFLARQLERRFPNLGDRLSTAVSFADASYSAGQGSSALQRYALAETAAIVPAFRLADLLHLRRLQLLTVAAACLLLGVGSLLLVAPTPSRIALRRIALPLSPVPWPKRVEWQVLGNDFAPLPAEVPLRVARGTTLELLARNGRGRLPGEIQLEVIRNGGAVASESLRRTTLRDEKGKPHEVAPFRLTAGAGDTMQFRLRGGDDENQPFRTVEIVPPPTVAALQVRLTPPAYSGQPPVDLPPNVGHVRGLVGTRVEVRAVASKPLKKASLRRNDKPAGAATIAADGKTVTAELTLSEAGSGSYHLLLEDTDGFRESAPPRYDLQGIADKVPEVELVEPDRDLTVTRAATVNLRGRATDDLELESLRLSWSADRAGAPQTIPLPDPPAGARQATTTLEWRLADLPLPTSEDEMVRITYALEATDRYDLGPPHVGRSLTRSLLIVSPEQKRQELAGRAQDLAEDLEKLRQQQQGAAQLAGELVTQWERTGELRSMDLDALKRLELDQRRITERLTGPSGSVRDEAAQLPDEAARNGLEPPDFVGPLRTLAETLGELSAETLPRLESTLANARRLATDPAPESDAGKGELAASLKEAGRTQEELTGTLEGLLAGLKSWENEHGLRHELGELLATQERLQAETTELRDRSLSQPGDEPSPQTSADLEKLATRQRAQASRVEQWGRRLGEAAGQLESRSPDAARQMRDAAETLRKVQTAEQLRHAAEQIGRNQTGAALDTQAAAMAGLRRAADRLSDAGGQADEQALERMRGLEDRLQAEQTEQEESLRKREEATRADESPEREEQLRKLDEELGRQQSELEAVQEELAQLRLRRPAAALERAVDRLAQLKRRSPGTEAAETLRGQREAIDALEQARRELARERRRLESSLVAKRMEELGSQVAGAVERQKSLVAETTRLRELVAQRGSLSRPQLKTLRDLSQAQSSLAEDVAAMGRGLGSSATIAFVLKTSAESMTRAAQAMEGRDLGPTTADAQALALKRLEQLQGSLAQSGGSNEAPMSGGSSEGPPQPPGPPKSSVPRLAELKLCRALQEELLTRTQALEEAKAGGSVTTEEYAEATRAMAAEQEALGELLRNLAAELLPDGAPTE